MTLCCYILEKRSATAFCIIQGSLLPLCPCTFCDAIMCPLACSDLEDFTYSLVCGYFFPQIFEVLYCCFVKNEEIVLSPPKMNHYFSKAAFPTFFSKTLKNIANFGFSFLKTTLKGY